MSILDNMKELLENKHCLSENYIIELSSGAIKKAIAKFVQQDNDEQEVTSVVTKFNDLANRKQIKGVDIFQIKTFDELKHIVQKSGASKSRGEKEKIIKDKETEIVFKNNDVLIVSPKTSESSRKYGCNTKWCTASTNPKMWDEYRLNGDKLYYIIPKDGGEKTAVKVERNDDMEIYDEKDNVKDYNYLKGIANQYGFNVDLFKPLDDATYDKIIGDIELTDEYFRNFVVDMLPTIIPPTHKGFDNIANKMVVMMQQKYYDILDKPSNEEFTTVVRGVIEQIKKDTSGFENHMDDALTELKRMYGIDNTSVNNKIHLIGDVIKEGSELSHSIRYELDPWGMEDVKKQIKDGVWEMISNLESFTKQYYGGV